ncbi:MAG: CRTAC1 family protein [Terracidiphilus sp.]
MRRDLLRTIPAIVLQSLLPKRIQAAMAPKSAPPPFSRFVDVGKMAGLTEPTIYGGTDGFTYIIESMACGVAFIDYDNDGWLDIFIPSGRRLVDTPVSATNRLYKNNRDGTFTDVTIKAGMLHTGWAQGVCVGDYNNDGWEDLFITYYGQNQLYRNNGDGTFTDVTEKAGLLHPKTRFSSGCTFVDYNRDGLLDLFVSNYVEIDLATAPKPSLSVVNCNYEGVPTYCGPNGLAKPKNYLYRNNGDGTFTDVSGPSGIDKATGSYGLTAVAFDADEDGWPDIFVACDSTPSLLLMNNHDNTFREEGLIRGVALSGDGRELGGMGVGLGDYDLSGHLDIVKTHFAHQAPGIYKNDGKGNFEDVTNETGLNAESRYIDFGAGMYDFDNDGYPDIMISTGSVYPELERLVPGYSTRSPRLLFRNLGNGTFAVVTNEAGPDIGAKHLSRGLAFGDFDNDGDIDVLIMNVNEPPTLLRNDAPKENHWIKLRLVGVKSNRSAIGARVIARYSGKLQAQEVLSQSSFLSACDLRVHFGLGAARTVDLEIRWPSGIVQKMTGVAADQILTVRENVETAAH